MIITQTNPNTNHWLPKEISTASVGVGLTAISNLAIQFLNSTPNFLHTCLPSLAKNFMIWTAGATSIVGTVMTVYSMVRLGQKVISEKNELHKNVGILALGVLFTSVAETVGEHFWKLAPNLILLKDPSLFYALATNLAWHTAVGVGVGGIAFTAYGAYLLGRAILSPPTTKIELVVKPL